MEPLPTAFLLVVAGVLMTLSVLLSRASGRFGLPVAMLFLGIGMAAGLTEDTAGLGAVGAYKALSNYTALGGTMTVFTLPQ